MWFTTNDIIEEYGEDDLPYTTDETGQNVTNLSKGEKNLKSAEMFVKGFLEKAKVISYDVNGNEIPLSQNQIDFIREPVLTIARYYYSDKTTGENDIIVKRYETSVKMLNDIVNGNITFPKNPLVDDRKSNLFFNIGLVRG